MPQGIATGLTRLVLLIQAALLGMLWLDPLARGLPRVPTASVVRPVVVQRPWVADMYGEGTQLFTCGGPT